VKGWRPPPDGGPFRLVTFFVHVRDDARLIMMLEVLVLAEARQSGLMWCISLWVLWAGFVGIFWVSFCFGFFGVFFPFSSLSCFGVLLYTSYMLRGTFTLFIKFSTYQKKKKKRDEIKPLECVGAGLECRYGHWNNFFTSVVKKGLVFLYLCLYFWWGLVSLHSLIKVPFYPRKYKEYVAVIFHGKAFSGVRWENDLIPSLIVANI
jgi:hypothetical protein